MVMTPLQINNVGELKLLLVPTAGNGWKTYLWEVLLKMC